MTAGQTTAERPRRIKLLVFVLGGMLVALFLAGVVSNFASSKPDGLDAGARKGCTFDSHDRITGGDCIAKTERTHATSDSPLAHYGIRGIGNSYLSTGLAGIAGVLVVFAVGGGMFWVIRRRGSDTPGDAGTSA